MIEPKQARSLATRRRLLDAAVDILVEDGYLGLSAATVARRAGVSRGAHQHHFPNRQTLLIEALHHLSVSEQDVLRKRLAAVDKSGDGVVEGLDILFETFCGKFFATILELALASRREPELEMAILEEERSIAVGTHEFAEQIFGEDIYADPGFGPKWRYCRSVVRGVAALSFLGFDGISMLAEENKESARAIGRAMVAALLLAGTLFIVQTWVASLLVPDPDELIKKGDPGGTAFYDAARTAAGPWLSGLTALATAIAWGFANSLVAQAATSRLLYAMARDRQLPSFLAKVHRKHGVPVNATLLVAVVSLTLGLVMAARSDGITLLTTLVNFGALTGFLVLHVSVVTHYVLRSRSRRFFSHLAAPVIGFGILAYVVVNAEVAAQKLGFVWMAVGLALLAGLVLTGRRPVLPAMEGTQAPGTRQEQEHS